MSSTQGLSSQLAESLRARDAARRLLDSSERLGTDKSVSEEQRESLRREYQERVEAADAEVERVKWLIRDRRDEFAVELESIRAEEESLEIRHKVGEYTVAQLRNATADLRKRRESLVRLDASFAALLEAETESDVRRTARQPGALPSAGARTTERVTVEVAKESPVARGGGLRGGFASAAAITPRWLLYGSLGLVGVSAIVIVVLFVQAAGGAFNLPNPFQSGGDTVSAPPSGVDASPSTPATPPATVAPASAEFQMPVQLRGAPGIGSLYVELRYDTAAVEVLRVDAAALPADTLFESNYGQGRVVLGLVTSGGLSGDWIVAFVTCKRAAGAATSGESAMTISAVQAHQAADLTEVQAIASAGRVDLSNLAVVPPAIVCD